MISQVIEVNIAKAMEGGIWMALTDENDIANGEYTVATEVLLICSKGQRLVAILLEHVGVVGNAEDPM
jgi:hypothetical protein